MTVEGGARPAAPEDRLSVRWVEIVELGTGSPEAPSDEESEVEPFVPEETLVRRGMYETPLVLALGWLIKGSVWKQVERALARAHQRDLVLIGIAAMAFTFVKKSFDWHRLQMPGKGIVARSRTQAERF